MAALHLILVLVLKLAATYCEASSSQVERILSQQTSEWTFDELHKAAIRDHASRYIEPLKSLHTRQVKQLNGLYDFCLDPNREGFKQRWFAQPLAKAHSCRLAGDFYRMPVPSAFNEITSNETLKNYMGWFWYQTDFSWAAFSPSSCQSSNDSNWLIQFESINYLSLIWAQLVDLASNSAGGPAKLVGSHVGGHLAVVVNVSEFMHSIGEAPPARFKLRLSLAISNQLTADTIPSGQMEDLSQLAGKRLFQFKPDFDFFHYAGLMGEVQLVRLPALYIKRATFAIAAATIQDDKQTSNKKLLVNICLHKQVREISKLRVWTQRKSPVELQLHRLDNCRIRELDCATSRLVAELLPDGCNATATNYQRPITIMLELLDETRRGGDTFEAKPRLRTSEELISGARQAAAGQLQGFGMHHEQLFSGRTMSLAAIMKDLYLLKGMGANLVRTSHYPYSSAYLEAAGELELLVIAECPAVGLRSFSPIKLELHKQMLAEMFARDQDQASVVMWSVANEPQSQLNESRPYFESLLAFARQQLAEFTLLAGRPLTAAIAQSHQTDQLADLLDVIMVNRYYGWYECAAALETIGPALAVSLEGWARRHPGKPLLVSEFGADTLAGAHSGELYSEEYQSELIDRHERLFDKLARDNHSAPINFWGSMVWNFADFSTHQSIGRVGGNKKGVFTRLRDPKMAAHLVSQVYRARRAEL